MSANNILKSEEAEKIRVEDHIMKMHLSLDGAILLLPLHV